MGFIRVDIFESGYEKTLNKAIRDAKQCIMTGDVDNNMMSQLLMLNIFDNKKFNVKSISKLEVGVMQPDYDLDFGWVMRCHRTGDEIPLYEWKEAIYLKYKFDCHRYLELENTNNTKYWDSLVQYLIGYLLSKTILLIGIDKIIEYKKNSFDNIFNDIEDVLKRDIASAIYTMVHIIETAQELIANKKLTFTNKIFKEFRNEV